MKKIGALEIMNRYPKDFKHNIYYHGGSRIFIDGESGDRQLLVDTYYSKHFAEHIERCVREYFGLPDKEGHETSKNSNIRRNVYDISFVHDIPNEWVVAQNMVEVIGVFGEENIYYIEIRPDERSDGWMVDIDIKEDIERVMNTFPK